MDVGTYKGQGSLANEGLRQQHAGWAVRELKIIVVSLRLLAQSKTWKLEGGVAAQLKSQHLRD